MLNLIKHIELFKRGTYFQKCISLIAGRRTLKSYSLGRMYEKDGVIWECVTRNFEISHSRLCLGLLVLNGVCKIHDQICYLYVGKNVINGFTKQKSCLIVWNRTTHMNLQNARFPLFFNLCSDIGWTGFEKYFQWKKTCWNSVWVLPKISCPSEQCSGFPYSVPGLTFAFWTILNLRCWF